MARAALAMDMVKMGIYDPQAALDYIDDPRKEQIVKRLQAREQAAMQAEAMQKAECPEEEHKMKSY
jgi:hypothetical protein